MTTQRNELLELRDHLAEVLARAQRNRATMSCDRWIADERKAMVDEVNRQRRFRGVAGEVDTETFRRLVEDPACGHSDYSSKMALYSAWLVYDRRDLLCDA